MNAKIEKEIEELNKSIEREKRKREKFKRKIEEFKQAYKEAKKNYKAGLRQLRDFANANGPTEFLTEKMCQNEADRLTAIWHQQSFDLTYLRERLEKKVETMNSFIKQDEKEIEDLKIQARKQDPRFVRTMIERRTRDAERRRLISDQAKKTIIASYFPTAKGNNTPKKPVVAEPENKGGEPSKKKKRP